ncbi:MAG: hypothetical protein KDB27_28505 [Planctomycetales bacterium]|nr:hypothetical protein [Planctomycetales bacterium]
MKNDKSKELYRLASSEQQKRVGEFADVEDSTSRKNEIAVCRTLIEEAVQKGNVSLANSLLNTLDRLQKNEFRRQLIEHELLTRPSIFRFANRLVEIMCDEISQLNGWEDVMIRVSERVSEALAELKNEAKDTEGLSLPR